MQGRKIPFYVVLIFFFICSISHGADVAKIGVVDFQKILQESSPGKAAQAEINKHGKKMEMDLKRKGAEIEGMKKKLQEELMVMNREMRLEKEREIRIRANDLNTLQKKYMGDFRLQESRLLNRIQKEVVVIVEKMGKAEGYLLIVDKRTVVYSPNTIDITDKIIKKYNALFADKLKPKAKTKKK